MEYFMTFQVLRDRAVTKVDSALVFSETFIFFTSRKANMSRAKKWQRLQRHHCASMVSGSFRAGCSQDGQRGRPGGTHTWTAPRS